MPIACKILKAITLSYREEIEQITCVLVHETQTAATTPWNLQLLIRKKKMDTDSSAIKVTGANRFYGSLHVLKDLEMNVPHGCMYVYCSYSCTSTLSTETPLTNCQIDLAWAKYCRKGSCIIMLYMFSYHLFIFHSNYVISNSTL